VINVKLSNGMELFALFAVIPNINRNKVKKE
jgi:hypothetical protein